MKHKMWSRLLSMALAVMMITSIVPNSAFAEAASEITNSTSQVQVEETPVVENDVPQDEVTVPEEETPVESVEPTAEPTADPMAEPTAEPTQAPEATAVPSEQPSAEPTAAPEATEAPNASAQPSETPAPSESPAPSASPLPSETPAPTETPAATEEPAIDGQALLDELMAIEDDEAFMKAVNELTEEQVAALEALGEDALADYTLRVESLTAPEETVELNAEAKEFTTAVEGVDGVTVTVKVPEGALPVDAELKATMIDQSSEEYAKAEEALADENLNEQPAEYDGMVALDIRFEVGGQEVEPLKEVEVSIDAQALLPEDADPETVAVQHLKEDVTGEVVAVETVADATEETGEVTIEAAPAEETALNVASTFAVDGFSKFTITWESTRLDKEVELSIVDSSGNPIPNSPDANHPLGNFTIFGGGSDVYYIEKILKDDGIYQFDANGETYIFQRARVYDGSNIPHPVDSFQIVYNVTSYMIRFYDMVYGGETGFWTDNGTSDKKKIELVYRTESETDSDDIYTKTDLVRTKKVTKSAGDDQYTLELGVSGAVGSITSPVKMDIVFVIDKSASMEGSWWLGDNKTQLVEESVRTLVNQLENNNMIDPKYSMVYFGEDLINRDDRKHYRDAITAVQWTDNAESIISAAGVEATSGNTNYQAGLVDVRSLLIESRNNAQKYVIFVSDGVPNRYYDQNGDTASGNSNQVMDAAIQEASKITNLNGFFTIRVGNEKGADDVLTRICEAAYKEGANLANFKNYPAENATELAEAFKEIEGNITYLLCDHVVVTDTLSQYVDQVDDPVLKITDATGADVTAKEKGGIASVKCENGTLTVDFVDEYQLKQGYTYTVTMQIKASDQAYKEYAEKGASAYNGTGQPGTGDYAGDNGFYTNGTATVKYQYNEQDQENSFLQPVIQVHPGELKITKKIDGDILSDAAKLGALKANLKFKVTLNDEDPFELKLTGDPDRDGVYTIIDSRLKNLKPGTTYTIEEIDFGVDGYECETKIGGRVKTEASGTISASQTDKVAFTNTYTAQDGELTFTKTLDKLCDGDTMALFTVEIKNTETGEIYYKTLKFNASTFDDTFTITLPVGEYQIRELSNLGYTNGEIKQNGATLGTNGDYYNFKITPGGKTKLTVENTANNNNSSKIDKDTAVNRFTKDNDGWTWKRQ